MMRAASRVLVAALLASIATLPVGARAEVRLQVNGLAPSVAIVATADGVWSPIGRVDGRTLNPSGDDHGHGTPTWARSGRRVLAAWPEGDAIGLAIGDGNSWTRLRAVPAGDPISTLVVLPVGNLWCIAWQTTGAAVEAHALFVTAGGQQAEVVRLDDARLETAYALGADGVRLIVTDRSGLAWAETIVVAYGQAPLDPFPMPSSRVPLSELLTGRGVLTAIPALTLPVDRLLAPPGVPILIPTAHGWGLIWSEGGTPTTIRAKTVSADGRLGTPIDLAEGRIIGTTSAADGSTHVVILRPDGQLTDIVTTFGIPTAPQPVDAPTIAQTSDIERITDTVHADVRINTLPTATVLTWWASPRELRFVELGLSGPVYPIRSFESRGATTYQQVLIRRALDEFSAK